MNIRKLLLISAAILGLGTLAFAQEATVARVTGAANVTLPNGSTTPLATGMKIPQGATITTGADGDVYLETHKGYVTSIKQNSVVSVDDLSVTTEGKERTYLNLKSGNLVAKLDPSKKAVNDYQVRTPKGVAAARGTVFTVAYNGGNYSIAVINGQVIITPPAGQGIEHTGVGLTVNAGQATASLNGHDIPTAVPVAEAVNNPEFRQASGDITRLLSLAVATVAVAAENNIGGTTAAELRQVADAIIQAVPAAAPAIAALVQVSAPTQSQAIVDSTAANAPGQSGAVNNAINNSSSGNNNNGNNSNSNNSNNGNSGTQVTTPQPIDPTTVSRGS